MGGKQKKGMGRDRGVKGKGEKMREGEIVRRTE